MATLWTHGNFTHRSGCAVPRSVMSAIVHTAEGLEYSGAWQDLGQRPSGRKKQSCAIDGALQGAVSSIQYAAHIAFISYDALQGAVDGAKLFLPTVLAG